MSTLQSATLNLKAEHAIRWAQLHGMCMTMPYTGTKYTTQPEDDWNLSNEYYFAAKHAPFVLTPSPFPKQAFNDGKELCAPFNILVDCVARDTQFLRDTLIPAAKTDEFTRNLLDIHERVLHANPDYAKTTMLGLHRSDYMIQIQKTDDSNSNANSNTQLRQIEINTIASSFGALGTLTSKLHSNLHQRFHEDDEKENGSIPDNNALEGLVLGLATAYKQYQYGCDNDNAVVLFVVQAGEGNVFDQRHLENALFEKHNISSIRRSLSDLASISINNDNSNKLIIDGKEVAVVYYRAGYTPLDYPTMDEWHVREQIELSKSIKCPSVAYQLAGAKKIQQKLADDGILERFVPVAAAKLLRSSFAGLYELNAGTIEMALASPGKYVLKPQREGGGNNIYDDDLVKTLQSMDDSEMDAYILMERITPPIRVQTPFIRDGVLQFDESVSEFGVYGTFLGNGGGVIMNECAGTLLRTKATKYADGGVAAGVAYLDSPILH